MVDGDQIVGFVCTTRYSEALGWQFGMALVSDHLAVEGGSLDLYERLGSETSRCTATIVPPHFYDPDGERMRA